MALKFSRLTRPAIRSLAPGQRINEHGITAERLRNGDVRYSVNIMVDGQRVHRVIGRESEGVTREQAERAIETFRTKARDGRLDLPQGRKVHRSFKEAATDYLERLEQTLAKGQKGFADLPNKRRNVEKYLIPYFGDKRADKITTFLVRHYVKKRLDEGTKIASVNRELATLNHMIRQWVSWKWIKEEDRPEITKDEEPGKKIVILTPKQVEELYLAAVADQDPATHLFIAIASNAAMRHSEILRIRWDDVYPALCRMYIGEAKAGQREQPITSALADLLANAHQGDSEWIFPATRADCKKPYRHDMGRQFARAAERAGLDPKKVTPHVLRHTGITRLVQAGVPLPTIQRISGHKTLAALMRYVHLGDEHIDQAITALESGFLGKVTPELHTAPETEAPDSASITPLRA